MTKPEIAKLGHAGLVTADLEKSLWFFQDVIGLVLTEEKDGVYYLRATNDFEHHTLAIREGKESYIDHIAWKTKRPEDVDKFAELLQFSGTDIEWKEQKLVKEKLFDLNYQVNIHLKFILRWKRHQQMKLVVQY